MVGIQKSQNVYISDTVQSIIYAGSIVGATVFWGVTWYVLPKPLLFSANTTDVLVARAASADSQTIATEMSARVTDSTASPNFV